MIKKYKKLFLFNVIIIIFYTICIHFLSKLDMKYVSDIRFFLNVPNKIKIANLGSSHGRYGIKYNNVKNAYNLGLSSQNLYYDSKILEQCLAHFEKSCKIIIPISVFSLYNGKSLEDTFLNERYYLFLDYNDVIGGNKFRSLLYKNFYLFINPKEIPRVLNFLLECIKKKEVIIKELEYVEKNWSKEKLIADTNKTVKIHLEKKELHLEYVKSILEICIKNNLEPILITTPFTYIYNEKIGDKNYEERVYKQICELRKEYNFIYLDYSRDKRITNNLEYFSDGHHLNEKGAEYFTEILLNDINYNN